MTIQEAFNQFTQALEPVFGTVDPVLVGRLLLVCVLCGTIGFERSSHEKASGFRQHILVGLGACLMAMVGGYGLPDFDGQRDPMRVASYVVSGIGFLGAGAILRHGTTVIGITTAASIWGAAGLGIAVGLGLGGLAAVTTVLILFTLTILERLEEWFQSHDSTDAFDVHLKDDARAVGKALSALTRLGVPIKRATVLPGPDESGVLHVVLSQPLKDKQIARMVENLLTLKFVEWVDTGGIHSVRDNENGEALPQLIVNEDDEDETEIELHP